jgi:hypothetical protein
MAGQFVAVIPGVPLAFRWAVRPEAWAQRTDGSLEVDAAPHTPTSSSILRADQGR